MIAAFLIVMQLNKSPVDYSHHFETLPYLEEMISDVSRSESVTVLSPTIGEALKGSIIFQWEGLEDETVYLILLDNLGEELFRFTTVENLFRFKKKLTPGLYYWKLETEEELVFLGKFSVSH